MSAKGLPLRLEKGRTGETHLLMDDRPQIKIRWSELRLIAICALAYGIAIGLLLPGVWRLMPFPALPPIEIAALLAFLIGFLTRRMWVIALPVTALVALNPHGSSFAGALVAMVVLWPFAAAAGLAGMFAGKALQRQMLRRTLKAARRRERAKKAGAPLPV
jgi:hypothetical protein